MAHTSIYLTLEAKWSKWNPDTITSIAVVGTTKTRPRNPRGPVVKLTLNLPDQAFMPLRPEVTIDIPEEAIDFTPVVTVEMPEVVSS